MLPLAKALEQTGGVALIADGLVAGLGPFGPLALLAGVFVLAALIGMFISNTATALLMAPIAIAAAQQVGVSPYPFAMTVVIAASAAFVTPVSSPVNTLVLAPGGYRCNDFVRVGLPLFQAWRQGPLVDARRADLARVGAERDATLREHEAMLEAGIAQHAALTASVARARELRLPRARQRAEAASAAFAAGNSTASELIAARRDALEAELDLLMLEERLAMTGAALTLQYAEIAP
jgi:outer membrane protein TolC